MAASKLRGWASTRLPSRTSGPWTRGTPGRGMAWCVYSPVTPGVGGSGPDGSGFEPREYSRLAQSAASKG